MQRRPLRCLIVLLPGIVLLPAGCSMEDSATASHAQHLLLGMTPPDLESCLGVPDKHSEFGSTAILTWDSTSTAGQGLSVGLPVVGNVSISGGGSCHTTIRMENGRATEVRYSGEDSALLAPNAYCAPIVRSCVRHPEPTRGAVPAG